LRERIEGRRRTAAPVEVAPVEEPIYEPEPPPPPSPEEEAGWQDTERVAAISDDSLLNAKQDLAAAVENLVAVLRSPEARGMIPQTDRTNLAKYLMIAKLKLENAIALVRSETPDY
jgi:hypothetical protein